MTAKKTHWLRTSIIILLVCAIAGLALTYTQFFGNPTPTYASATIEFTFDGAADGIAPNGSAFSISDIASEDVLTDALDQASLKEVYTVEQLRNSLVARGVYPEDMAARVMSYESLLNFTANQESTITEFHPTTFNIALYNYFDKSISRENLESLMHAIVDSYKAYFARNYANGLQKGNMLFVLDEYDYPQQLEIIQGHFNTLANYAQEMYSRQPVFRYNGAGFNDISVRLNNLINSDITRLNADLTMNALTRDTARLLTQYQFEIRDLTNQLEKQNAQLEKMDALIASYDKNEIIYLSTTDSLTKIDGNSSETYDTLVDQRKEVADGITEINSQISNYQLKLSDLLKDSSSTDDGKAETTAVEKPATPASAAIAAETASETDDEADGSDDSSLMAAEDVVEMTEEEIAAAAAEAERLARAQTEALEKDIDALVEKGDAIIDDFKDMLQAYNDQEINDLTITATNFRYKTPKVLSGAFVKQAIKTAGPICALGFMLCMVLIIISRKREEKQLSQH